jgi:hypothetical protein
MTVPLTHAPFNGNVKSDTIAKIHDSFDPANLNSSSRPSFPPNSGKAERGHHQAGAEKIGKVVKTEHRRSAGM